MHKAVIVTHAYDPELRRQMMRSSRLSSLQSEFEYSLGYMTPCLKIHK